MKVVILAGGLGTRISEELSVRPKPMVDIGGKPVLWHVMKTYSHYGFNEFVICLGFKGYMVKEYFSNYFLHMSDITIDLTNNAMKIHQQYAEPWLITLVDTGGDTMTGGRIKRVAPYLGNGTFLLTYGDGLSDVNITELVEYHKRHGRAATVTSTQPTERFGTLRLDYDNKVVSFQEKPACAGSWGIGGFFVLEPYVLEMIADDFTIFEKEPLEGLALDQQLVAFKHTGFWHTIDTLRDKIYLEDLWSTRKAPWKVWE